MTERTLGQDSLVSSKGSATLRLAVVDREPSLTVLEPFSTHSSAAKVYVSSLSKETGGLSIIEFSKSLDKPNVKYCVKRFSMKVFL